ISKLFQHRFSSSGDLEGHNFGNLFLAALTAMTGDFAVAVMQASEILATRGHIQPANSANVQLEAIIDDGSHVLGETNINTSHRRIVEPQIVPANPEPLPQALAAIAAADVITMGPGSLFTSLVTNLLVRGIPEAIANSPAVKVFICNLMTEANESLNMKASDHIKAIYAHSPRRISDYALVNTAGVSAIVIMAAGKGTRLNSKRAKVLHEIGGQPLLAHVIKAAQQIVPAEHIYVIVGHQAENVRAAVAPMGVKFVLQADQRGTGHAI